LAGSFAGWVGGACLCSSGVLLGDSEWRGSEEGLNVVFGGEKILGLLSTRG